MPQDNSELVGYLRLCQLESTSHQSKHEPNAPSCYYSTTVNIDIVRTPFLVVFTRFGTLKFIVLSAFWVEDFSTIRLRFLPQPLNYAKGMTAAYASIRFGPIIRYNLVLSYRNLDCPS